MERVALILLYLEGRGEHPLGQVTKPCTDPKPISGPGDGSQELTLTEGLHRPVSSSEIGVVLGNFLMWVLWALWL